MRDAVRRLAFIGIFAAGLSAYGVAALQSPLVGVMPKDDEVISKVVFIKTHGTGSSTLTGILHRYCETHGLACFVHPRGVNPGFDVYPAKLAQLVQEFAHDPAKRRLDVWPSHTFFEPALFDQLIPGSVKFSVFRNPLTRVVSSLSKYKDADGVWKVLEDLRANQPMDPEHPCGIESQLMSRQVPPAKLGALDFVLLTEQYDLSVVLLRRRFNWNTRDVVYVPLKKQPEDPQFQAARAALNSYLVGEAGNLTSAADKLVAYCIANQEQEVYDLAHDRFQEQWSALSSADQHSVKKELKEFRRILADVAECCDTYPRDDYCLTLREDNIRWTKRQLNLLGETASRCAKLVHEVREEG